MSSAPSAERGTPCSTCEWITHFDPEMDGLGGDGLLPARPVTVAAAYLNAGFAKFGANGVSVTAVATTSTSQQAT
jgi:hypothetical protein